MQVASSHLLEDDGFDCTFVSYCHLLSEITGKPATRMSSRHCSTKLIPMPSSILQKKDLTFVYKLTREATLCAKILNTIRKLTYMSLPSNPYKRRPS